MNASRKQRFGAKKMDRYTYIHMANGLEYCVAGVRVGNTNICPEHLTVSKLVNSVQCLCGATRETYDCTGCGGTKTIHHSKDMNMFVKDFKIHANEFGYTVQGDEVSRMGDGWNTAVFTEEWGHWLSVPDVVHEQPPKPKPVTLDLPGAFAAQSQVAKDWGIATKIKQTQLFTNSNESLREEIKSLKDKIDLLETMVLRLCEGQLSLNSNREEVEAMQQQPLAPPPCVKAKSKLISGTPPFTAATAHNQNGASKIASMTPLTQPTPTILIPPALTSVMTIGQGDVMCSSQIPTAPTIIGAAMIPTEELDWAVGDAWAAFITRATATPLPSAPVEEAVMPIPEVPKPFWETTFTSVLSEISGWQSRRQLKRVLDELPKFEYRDPNPNRALYNKVVAQLPTHKNWVTDRTITCTGWLWGPKEFGVHLKLRQYNRRVYKFQMEINGVKSEHSWKRDIVDANSSSWLCIRYPSIKKEVRHVKSIYVPPSTVSEDCETGSEWSYEGDSGIIPANLKTNPERERTLRAGRNELGPIGGSGTERMREENIIRGTCGPVGRLPIAVPFNVDDLPKPAVDNFRPTYLTVDPLGLTDDAERDLTAEDIELLAKPRLTDAVDTANGYDWKFKEQELAIWKKPFQKIWYWVTNGEQHKVLFMRDLVYHLKMKAMFLPRDQKLRQSLSKFAMTFIERHRSFEKSPTEIYHLILGSVNVALIFDPTEVENEDYMSNMNERNIKKTNASFGYGRLSSRTWFGLRSKPSVLGGNQQAC
jgi:hypothetical protein